MIMIMMISTLPLLFLMIVIVFDIVIVGKHYVINQKKKKSQPNQKLYQESNGKLERLDKVWLNTLLCIGFLCLICCVVNFLVPYFDVGSSASTETSMESNIDYEVG